MGINDTGKCLLIFYDTYGTPCNIKIKPLPLTDSGNGESAVYAGNDSEEKDLRSSRVCLRAKIHSALPVY